ncbi:MAG: DEAD/DEAH box helicase family protein [Methanofollis sp.]|uniref:type I restriction endonuclease subunit R n=1 Tax=Methanofollis sp. TaxID=2052835 RepID=UPI00260EA994|nr:DEAD/DEAH box helicase family protein [Methanofollis sp.]MDD4254080.1 DEAD/DEAH box helicase family protein [Methanofollis sp.]
MTATISEADFETTIVTTLAGARTRTLDEENPFVDPRATYTIRTSADYDRNLCLIPKDLCAFIYATQGEEWEKLKAQRGADTRHAFLRRLKSEIEKRGTIDVLRKGIKDLGCTFHLAYFKPNSGLNETHKHLYRSNIFSVVRQLHFSTRSEKSLDLAIFVNGIPIFTAELKDPLTGQTVNNAIQQYRKDRDPKEPLFRYGRCLAHFAVDPLRVSMTTQLEGDETRFLPFNRGDPLDRDHPEENPKNPDGYATAYLWEEVWNPKSVLDIIEHFVQEVDKHDKDGKKIGKKIIFPRYHQLDAVRRIITHTHAAGAGQAYLVQHSAGSGKSNTIAWLAYYLTSLYDHEDRRLFDSVIVITDRRVLDQQLQENIRQFEQVKGVVSTISGRKAKNLSEAFSENKDIIVVTVQTFPHAVEEISRRPGNRFAVIIDEAHSSQSGRSARSVKEVLSPASLQDAETEDTEDEDSEDAINTTVEEYIKKTQRLPNVSFFAFTATPKQKTLELFGRKNRYGNFEAFHLYTMQQAIAEGFILDVLENYTTFKVYFELLKRIKDDPQYPKRKATALIRSYVDLHEHAINKKCEIILDHFTHETMHRIGGQAKAMIVTRSRLHAVRYKQTIDRFIRDQGLPFKALVAFSGEVVDPDLNEKFTESGMNGFSERQTAAEFEKQENRILIVANKYQTGFDQPLLHTMYVDKKLSGVAAVQTLSRLDRIHPQKTETMVLDFANGADEIEKAFAPYFQKTLLDEPTDPNKLYDLQYRLDHYSIYTPEQVEAFGNEYFSRKGRQEKLQAIIKEVVGQYIYLEKEDRDDFKKTLRQFVNLYAFLSQIITFQDVPLEKYYQFARYLKKALPKDDDRLPIDVIENINMESYSIRETSNGQIMINADGTLQQPDDRPTQALPEECAPLSEIIEYINENFGTDFTDEDKIAYFADDMEKRLIGNTALQQTFNPDINSRDNIKIAFNNFFDDTLVEMLSTNKEIFKRINDDNAFALLFKNYMFNRIYTQLLSGTG